MLRAVALSALLVAGCGATAPRAAKPPAPTATSTRPTSGGAAVPPGRHPSPPHPPFKVGEQTVTFVDHSRQVEVPGRGLVARTLITVVRYPHAPGRFPLIVFGHGFAVTPATYSLLLEAWARAGYVVAAPVFPLENANAPGGPNESDIVNQPSDMSFVITQLLRSGLADRINAREVAVSGQSDGGNTALAVAYGTPHRDHRIRAAVILSGGEVPRVSALAFPAGAPPLLATQGTADTINPPSFTHAFFDVASEPKYLLDLLGAPHLPPYTGGAPWAPVTDRVTTAFLDFYLKGQHAALGRMRADADLRGVARLEMG